MAFGLLQKEIRARAVFKETLTNLLRYRPPREKCLKLKNSPTHYVPYLSGNVLGNRRLYGNLTVLFEKSPFPNNLRAY